MILIVRSSFPIEYCISSLAKHQKMIHKKGTSGIRPLFQSDIIIFSSTDYFVQNSRRFFVMLKSHTKYRYLLVVRTRTGEEDLTLGVCKISTGSFLDRAIFIQSAENANVAC